MIQSVIRYIKGYVKIRVEGYSPERFLNLCSHHRIFIWGLNPVDRAYEMYMEIKGFRKLKPIIRKTQTKVVITRRYGLPFFIRKYRKRKLFFIGILFCISLMYLYSCFIWDIHFEGNKTRTNEVLLDYLASRDVSPHMRKSEVDCEQIVRDIRKQYDDIVWVSASIDGTRLRIQIKENEDTIREMMAEQSPENPKDLIAQKDGVITKIVTRAGVPQVHIGDTVKAGDVLVSGRVEVKNDAAEVVGYQYQVADADIEAATAVEYEDTLDTVHLVKQYAQVERSSYYIKLGAYTIRLGVNSHPYEEWDKMTEEHQLKLGENSFLPLSFGKAVIRPYTSKETNYSKKELQALLSADFKRYCDDLEKKGIQITDNSVKIHIDQNVAAARGGLSLIEPIAKEADTEIIEIERNESDESLGINNEPTD